MRLQSLPDAMTSQGTFCQPITKPFFLSNRILSKVQKSFLSCTHVNSCQNHILYINLHILLNILS